MRCSAGGRPAAAFAGRQYGVVAKYGGKEGQLGFNDLQSEEGVWEIGTVEAPAWQRENC